jgi:hypothetical protein
MKNSQKYFRAPLEVRNPSGFHLSFLGQNPTSKFTRAKTTPSFGSPRTQDVSTLPTPFPRGAPSPPPGSWRRRPVHSSCSHESLPPPRLLPVDSTMCAAVLPRRPSRASPLSHPSWRPQPAAAASARCPPPESARQ